MTGNFNIFSHQNSSHLHLVLKGDFDDISAHELLLTLKKNGQQVDHTFVHTNGLRKVSTFGETVFRSHASELKEIAPKIIFTGDYSSNLSFELYAAPRSATCKVPGEKA